MKIAIKYRDEGGKEKTLVVNDWMVGVFVFAVFFILLGVFFA